MALVKNKFVLIILCCLKIEIVNGLSKNETISIQLRNRNIQSLADYSFDNLFINELD